MEFSLAVQKNAHQVQLFKFNTMDQTTSDLVVDIDDMKDQKPQVYVYQDALAQAEELNKFFPVVSDAEYQISAEMMSYDEGLKVYQKAVSRWTLLNNLQTIENLVATAHHLKQLWAKDRHQFFEELWFNVFRTLGTTDLKILFNDVNEVPQDKEKNVRPKLIQSKVDGVHLPELMPATSEESKLMETFATTISNSFEIASYNMEQGQLVMTVNINRGPVLILAKCPQMTSLQKAILKGLFDGIQ